MEQLEMFEFLQPVVPKQSESMLCCRCQHASRANGPGETFWNGFFSLVGWHEPCRLIEHMN